MPNLYPTSFCWKCGKELPKPLLQATKADKFIVNTILNFNSALFCNKKHQEQYERSQER